MAGAPGAEGAGGWRETVGRVRRRAWVDPVVIGAGGAAWGAIGYGRPSLWTDEAATITSAQRSLPQLWRMVHRVDSVHGLYYLLMHVWVRLVGTSTWALRAPSVLAVGVAVAGTVVLGRLLAGPVVGAYAGVVLAVLPRTTWAAEQARSPALTMVVVAWLTVLLVLALRRGRWWWAAYAALAAAGVLLFLYLVLVVLAHGLTVAWTCRGRWRRALPYAAAAGVAVLATLPFVHLSLTESGQIHPRPLALSWVVPGVLVEQWFFGFAPQVGQDFLRWRMPLWGWAAVVVAVLCLALAAVGVVVEGVRRRPSRRPDAVGPVAALLPVVVVPTALLVGWSVHHPVYSPRYLAFAAPALAGLVALGLAARPVRWSRVAADWALVAAALAPRTRPGDALVLPPRGPDRDEAARLPLAYPAPFAGLVDPTLRRTGADSGTLWGVSRPLTPASLAGAPRVWLLTDRGPRTAATRSALATTIASAGYRPAWSWHGTVTDVQEYVPAG